MKIYGEIKGVVPLYKARDATVENLIFIREHCPELSILGIVNDGDYEFWRENVYNENLVDDLMYNDRNGVYRAWNLGIQESDLQGFKYTFIFSNDTVFTNNCVDNLMYPTPAPSSILCCEQFFNADMHGYRPKTPNTEEFLLRDASTLTRPKNIVDQAHFSAFLVTNDLFDVVGRFDESFSIYMGDVDFTYRLLTNGIKLLTNMNALVFHKDKTHLFSPSVREHDLTEFIDIIGNDAEFLYAKHKKHWKEFCHKVATVMLLNLEHGMTPKGYFEKENYKALEKDSRLLASL